MALPKYRQQPARPPDLYRNFGGTRLLPAQRRFLASGAMFRLFSSGYGAGKSKVGCRESIRYAVEYPGSRNMVSRLQYATLFDSTYVTFKRELREIGFVEGPRGRGHYRENRNDHEIVWWNGSVTLFRRLDDEEHFGGVEVNTIFVDEGSECPDSVYRILTGGRLRWHTPACPHSQGTDTEPEPGACQCPRRMWVCTNPGASGFLRKMFLGNQDGDPNKPPHDPDWYWVSAAPGENRHNGASYYQNLNRLAETYGAAWAARYRDGDWSVFEGQRFTMWNDREHIVPPWTPDPEALRDHRYTICVGVDYGFDSPTFFTFTAIPTLYLNTGRLTEPIVVFDEYSRSGVEIPDHAREIIRRLTQHGINLPDVRFGGDPAGRQRTAGSAYSPMHQYAQHGINTTPGAKMPDARAHILAALLTTRIQTPDGPRPGIIFTTDTPKTIESIVNLRYKPNHTRYGEDTRETFLKVGDHGFDSLGYALTAAGIQAPTTRDIQHKLEHHPGIVYPPNPDQWTPTVLPDVATLNGITI